MTDSALLGKDVLLLEDEVFVNMAAAQELEDAGCAVRAVFSIEDASKSVDERLPDAAVLDLNIAGVMSYPVAERLAQANIPLSFLLATIAPHCRNVGINTRFVKKRLPPEYSTLL